VRHHITQGTANMTNLEILLQTFTTLALAEKVLARCNEAIDILSADLDNVAYCDITDPEHDDVLAREYDRLVHELQAQLTRHEMTMAIRDLAMARIDDLARVAADFIA